MPSEPTEENPDRFVSTGALPAADDVQALVSAAYEKFRDHAGGRNSIVYPALAKAPSDRFGICVASTDGRLFSAGDVDAEFTIMSVAKPFVFALVCQAIGPEECRRRLGANATGLPFNALAAVERGVDGATNPMVNPGAIATTSLIPGSSPEDQWTFIADGLSRFAGRPLALDHDVLASAARTNQRNRGAAWLLQSYDRIGGDPSAVLDLYTRQSCLSVTARDLAVMGATLADGGVNPISKLRVVDADTCRYTLAIMATAGLYETSGDWLYTIGLPGKSGIGGGIVTAAPGKGGLGTYAPPLDEYGNSVKGQLVARFLSDRLGLNLFFSAPDRNLD